MMSTMSTRGARPCCSTKKTQLLRIEARRRPAAAIVVDRSPWNWYAESSSCGLPPGECHGEVRSQPAGERPPGGDWRVWGYVAGRGAGEAPYRALLGPSTTKPAS